MMRWCDFSCCKQEQKKLLCLDILWEEAKGRSTLGCKSAKLIVLKVHLKK